MGTSIRAQTFRISNSYESCLWTKFQFEIRSFRFWWNFMPIGQIHSKTPTAWFSYFWQFYFSYKETKKQVTISNDVLYEGLEPYISYKPFSARKLILYQYKLDPFSSTRTTAFFSGHQENKFFFYLIVVK
jgi:hypothetical protein